MSEPVKYAGIYDTVEALENGYKSSQAEYNKVSTRAKELEQELSKYKKPDNYARPDGIADDIYNRASDHANKYNYTQDQFDSYLNNYNTKKSDSANIINTAKSYLGEEQVNSAIENIKSSFGDSLANQILDNITPDTIKKFANTQSNQNTEPTPEPHTPHNVTGSNPTFNVDEIDNKITQLTRQMVTGINKQQAEVELASLYRKKFNLGK